jgi:hypothetical protein
MKMDDFENRLQRRPLRQIPAEWRDGILSQARHASSSAHAPRSTLHPPRPWIWLSTIRSQLSTFLWPNPRAWAGLAAIWLALFAFNLATRDTAAAAAGHTKPASPEVLLAWREQTLLLVELIGPPERLVAKRPKPPMPRPRSERRAASPSFAA